MLYGKSQIITNLFTQWFDSLPVFVVWAVGLVIAIRRRREHPRLSRMVMIACAVSLLTLIFMPVAFSFGNKIHCAAFFPLMSIIKPCLEALSVGLLLNAAFLGRGERAMDAVEKPDKVVQTAHSGCSGTALRILAGIVRWTWRLCSIALGLFVGVFILVGLSQRPRISTDPGDLVMIAGGVIVFACLVVAWWREWLGGLIVLLMVGVLTVISAVNSWRKSGKLGGDFDAPVYFVLMLSMLIPLSWSLHTLNDSTTTTRKRCLALIIALMLGVLVVLCVWGMFHSPFNP
ncbi:MAG: hypothetical protein ABSB11_12095 [Sedimentisphaerales bacterium]|jgi:hypothetical protein